MYSIEIYINGQPHYLTDKGIKAKEDCTQGEADEQHYHIRSFATFESAVAAYYATGSNYPAFVCGNGVKHLIALN
jgi:hypothetical protein